MLLLLRSRLLSSSFRPVRAGRRSGVGGAITREWTDQRTRSVGEPTVIACTNQKVCEAQPNRRLRVSQRGPGSVH
jgi:hypothetical protein